MAGFNAVPGQVCTYPGNIVPAEDQCDVTPVVTQVFERKRGMKRHIAASPPAFLDRKMPLILRIAQ